MAENNSPSWWQTVPGILTGVAAIVTAVTGFMLAFNRTSSRTEPVTSSTSTSASPTTASSPSSHAAVLPTSSAGARASGTIALPELHEVKFAEGNPVVTILSASVEPIDAERRSLKFHVRYHNTGHRYDANFWDRSYRLIVDGSSRAPTNRLNEVVPNDSDKDGDVVFDVPLSVKDVVLQITAGEETGRLPFKLP